MRTGFSLISIKKKHGRLVRGVALFFVLFTGADIALPQYFCGDGEIGGTPTDSASLYSPADKSTVENSEIVSGTNDSRPERPAPEAPHNEDCFCCCAHVLPSLSFASAGAPVLAEPSDILISSSVLSPPLRGTYHPPRIA